jgi:hypothetical protein
MRWTLHVICVGKMRNASKILVGKPEEKRPLGRAGCGWEDNIRMDLKETGHKDVGLDSSGSR